MDMVPLGKGALLVKIPLVAAMAGGMTYSFTSPQPAPCKTETLVYSESEAREALLDVALVLSHVTKLRPTTPFVVGTALICIGAYLRSLCFRRLGKQFTFQLSIQKDHRLVTDGPYAVVRHPSYAAGVMQAIGFVICLAGPGTWWREFAVSRTKAGKVLGAVVCLQLALCTFGGFDRALKEDIMLKHTFKEQWTEWAKKTRWRMIPYIF